MDKIWDGLTRESIASMSREDCIALLSWNDHNGSFSDTDSVADGMEPMSTADARELLTNVRFGEV